MPSQPRAAPSEEALDALVAVLDEIRSTGSRSRSELVARTGLTRGVVAQRVGELIELGLVVEGEIGPSTGGRPPRRITFRGRRRATSWSPTSAPPASTSRSPTSTGRILGHRDEPADVAAGPERCLVARRGAVRAS